MQFFSLQKFDGNGCKMINGYGKKSATTTGVAGKCSIEEEDNKILEPKEELQYLSEALGFQVTYTEFPQKNTSAAMKKSVPEFITLVKLSTKPPKVSDSIVSFPGSWETGTGFSQPRVHTVMGKDKCPYITV